MDRGRGLKLGLLLSLGLLPIACGGALRDGKPEETSAGTGPTGASGSGGAITAVGGGPSRWTCTSPTVDAISGLVSCKEGFSHRPSAVSCDVVGGAPAEIGGAGSDAPEPTKPRVTDPVTCLNDSDCKAFELGYCDNVGLFSVCASGCLVDADCGPSEVCACTGYTAHGGECRPAGCQTDADCGAGSLCGSYSGVCGAGGFACFRALDECTSNADCDRAPCDYEPGSDGEWRRACSNAVCGRPFLVQDQPRVATLRRRADWCDATEPRPHLEHLSDDERATLARHWMRMGQMEHASIAAFARFSLQLLALGAPADLIERSTAALADETAHAKLCFGLASAYAGFPVGPAPLDISNSLTPTRLKDVVGLVIAEGCFGETSAALEALEAADLASDPLIAAAYSRIAADEQRHAELAFRFVRWALEQEPRLTSHVARSVDDDGSASPVVRDIVRACLHDSFPRHRVA